MAPPARLNATQLAQVRELIAEEFNNAFNEIIPNVTTNIIVQVRALLDERTAARPPAGVVVPAAPVRDLMYYYEKFGKCSRKMEKSPENEEAKVAEEGGASRLSLSLSKLKLHTHHRITTATTTSTPEQNQLAGKSKGARGQRRLGRKDEKNRLQLQLTRCSLFLTTLTHFRAVVFSLTQSPENEGEGSGCLSPARQSLSRTHATRTPLSSLSYRGDAVANEVIGKIGK